MKYRYLFLLPVVCLPYVVFASIVQPCGGDGGSGCGWADVISLINRIITYLLTIATILAVVSFIYAGFLLITAGGNSGKVSQAKDIFGSVVIGLVLAYGAWIIVHFIFAALGGQSQFSLLN